MDRLLSLQVFVSAVEEGSIAAAARRHGLSSVMAGRYLSALEDALPARLLHRTTRRLALTDAGSLYFARCKRLLEELEEADHEAAALQATPRGTLRLAAPVTFGAAYLGPVIGAYLADHPGLKVDVQLQDRFVDLIEEGIDIALRIGQLPDSELVAWPVSTCTLVACAAPRYLSRHGAPKSPDDLAAHARIGYTGTVSTTPWAFIGSDGKTHAVTEPCRFVANNTQMMAEAAVAGAGIAYGPSFAFSQHLQQGTLRQVLPAYATPSLTLHAVTPTARHVPQKVRLFRERLREAFGGDTPPWEAWREAAARAARTKTPRPRAKPRRRD